MNLLILHGPNLNLLGERPGDEKGRGLEQLNALIRERAQALGLQVKIFQSNHEGQLVDTLHAERRWADGVIINPAALTHSSYTLREALFAVDKPALEVHLTDIRRRESWRRKSVIKDVCAAQVLGKGFDSYLIALDRFAHDDLTGRKKPKKAQKAQKAAPVQKTLGRPAPKPAVAEGRAGVTPAPAAGGNGKPGKTLGRKQAEAPAAAAKEGSRPPDKSIGRAAAGPRAGAELLTRALVREKIAERLSGKLTPAGLATWARGRWLDVQRGAPAESGQREVLEDSLQSLVLSAMPASRLTEDQLVDLMTQLEG